MTVSKIEKSYRMCAGVIHLPNKGPLRKSMISLLGNLITSIGITAQQVLSRIKESLSLDFDENDKVSRARLKIVVTGDDIPRAERLLQKTMTDFGYTNSYRLVELHKRESGMAQVVFEIAHAKVLPSTRRVLDAMPANFLAQVLSSWGRYPEMEALPATLRGGLAQKVAEQLLSYVQLKDEDLNTSFPSTEERSPDKKRTGWLEALNRIGGNMSGFEYKRARDLDPTIHEDDPRGNRRINVDPDWIAFVDLPDVDRFPGTFEKNDVVVYRRYTDDKAKESGKEHYATNQGRLYALVPVSEVTDPRFLWWTNHKMEFSPLEAFGERKWPKKPCHVMVPLEYRDNLDILSDPKRSVKKTILVEEQEHRPGRHGHKGNNIPFLGKRWVLKFSTESVVNSRETDKILGVHFHEEDEKLSVVWMLMKDGSEIRRGEFTQEHILDYAVLRKEYLEGLQRSHRWVGGKQFRHELKRRTEELALRIVAIAQEHSASILIEDIKHVPKQGQGHDRNSKHSLWNYASLSAKIEFFAKDRHGLHTERRNEFVLKFKCPKCGAIRKGGENKDTATTWREGNVLHCRKCRETTLQDRYYYPRQIAMMKK
jgi:hypothetical protein